MRRKFTNQLSYMFSQFVWTILDLYTLTAYSSFVTCRDKNRAWWNRQALFLSEIILKKQEHGVMSSGPNLLTSNPNTSTEIFHAGIKRLQHKAKVTLLFLASHTIPGQSVVHHHFLFLSTISLQMKTSCHFSGVALSLLSVTFTSTKGLSTVAKVTVGPFMRAMPQPRGLDTV